MSAFPAEYKGHQVVIEVGPKNGWKLQGTSTYVKHKDVKRLPTAVQSTFAAPATVVVPRPSARVGPPALPMLLQTGGGFPSLPSFLTRPFAPSTTLSAAPGIPRPVVASTTAPAIPRPVVASTTAPARRRPVAVSTAAFAPLRPVTAPSAPAEAIDEGGLEVEEREGPPSARPPSARPPSARPPSTRPPSARPAAAEKPPTQEQPLAAAPGWAKGATCADFRHICRVLKVPHNNRMTKNDMITACDYRRKVLQEQGVDPDKSTPEQQKAAIMNLANKCQGLRYRFRSPTEDEILECSWRTRTSRARDASKQLYSGLSCNENKGEFRPDWDNGSVGTSASFQRLT